ncbi:MAG: hypothetical protein ACK4TO_09915, partial [Candidatus Nitrosotenuis sp.]
GTPFYDREQGKTYTAKRDVYSIYVRADSRLRFHKYVGFTIKRKQQRLEDYLVRTGRLLTTTSQTSPYF